MHGHCVEYSYLKILFVSPGSTKRLRAIHCEWFGRVLYSFHVQHKICHTIMMKIEWIRSGRTKECCILTNAMRNFSGICTMYALSIESLDGRTDSKTFNLSMCNGIMCFAFRRKDISVN